METTEVATAAGSTAASGAILVFFKEPVATPELGLERFSDACDAGLSIGGFVGLLVSLLRGALLFFFELFLLKASGSKSSSLEREKSSSSLKSDIVQGSM